MNRISEITKRDIFDLFESGLDIPVLWETERVHYTYYGRLEEIEFLKRIYDLSNMPSTDPRFPDAEGDIWQRTVNNDDYPACWVFHDDRFQLERGDDETYLKFICEVFHPAVRHEKGYWEEFLNEINRLLKNDGYELYPAEILSGREVYGWRIFSAKEEELFIPFSQRNAKSIKDKTISLSIKRPARHQIYQLLERHNGIYRKTDETGCDYDVSIGEEVFDDIRQFYVPKYFNKDKQYVETSSLQDFICHNLPYYVLDAIEFFEKYNQSTDFEAQINKILSLNNIPTKLQNGKIESTFTSQIKSGSLSPIQEAGLKELLQEASKYYDEPNCKIAAEKLWDAFERLKTYYSPTLDKKKSVSRIIGDMSGGVKPYEDLFEKEFRELTAIGNNFRIRHHETTKVNIEDERHYDYFYKRCMSLISIAILYLRGKLEY
ncbi:MAG TPA: hypothetical protein GX527_06335 [Clostridiaceae bacterium]|nr:hypothetical protein [Clostridiaceae bacterium]